MTPRPTLLLLTVLLAAACDETTVQSSERCEVVAASLAPTEASPGDAVTITATPQTTVWDTAVYVGRTRAELLSVDRDGCDACDTCREEAYCTVCADCDACDAVCKTECVETTTFAVPSGVSGQVAVRLFNVHGQSAPLSLTVQGSDTAAETGAGGETGETGSGGETGTP